MKLNAQLQSVKWTAKGEIQMELRKFVFYGKSTRHPPIKWSHGMGIVMGGEGGGQKPMIAGY